MIKRNLFILAQGAGAQIGLGFLASVIRIRLLGGEWYGMTAYLSSVLAVLPTMYDLFNTVLLRFLPQCPLNDRKRIFLFVIFWKTVIFISAASVIVSAIYGGLLDSAHHLLQQRMLPLYFAACLVSMFLDLFRTTFITVLKCEERYSQVALLTAGDSMVGLVCLGALYAARQTGPDAVGWLSAFLVVNSGLQLAWSFASLWRGTAFREWIRRPERRFAISLRMVFKRYFKPYCLPQSTEILFQYLKKNAVTLILGHKSGFDEITYYRVLTRVTELVSAFIPKTAQSLLPSVVKRRMDKREQFDEKYTKLGLIYLLGMGAITILFYLSQPLILAVYGLKSNTEIVWLVLFLCLSLHQISFGFLSNYLYQLSNQTRPSYAMVPINNIVYLASVFFLAPFGLIGMGVANLIHRFCGNMLLSYFAIYRMRLIAVPQYLRLTVVTAALTGGLVLIHMLNVWKTTL